MRLLTQFIRYLRQSNNATAALNVSAFCICFYFTQNTFAEFISHKKIKKIVVCTVHFRVCIQMYTLHSWLIWRIGHSCKCVVNRMFSVQIWKLMGDFPGSVHSLLYISSLIIYKFLIITRSS